MWMQISTLGKLEPISGNSLKNQKGFTLIELMVAMAIVGLIFAAAASGLRSVFNMGMKSDAGHLAAMVRALSNKAVTDHTYLRLVYDIDGRQYSVEESEEPFLVSMEDSSEAAKNFLEKNKKESTAKDSEGSSSEEDKADEGDKSDQSYTVIETGPFKSGSLSSNVYFKDIETSYSGSKIESGKAYTYFFPDGFATQTMIHLRDDDDEEYYSIEVSPVSGRVKTESVYREMGQE